MWAAISKHFYFLFLSLAGQLYLFVKGISKRSKISGFGHDDFHGFQHCFLSLLFFCSWYLKIFTWMFLCYDLFIYICKEQSPLIFQSALLLCQMFKIIKKEHKAFGGLFFPLRQFLIRNTCLLCVTTSILVAQPSQKPKGWKVNLHVLTELFSSGLICTKIKNCKYVPFIIPFTLSGTSPPKSAMSPGATSLPHHLDNNCLPLSALAVSLASWLSSILSSLPDTSSVRERETCSNKLEIQKSSLIYLTVLQCTGTLDYNNMDSCCSYRLTLEPMRNDSRKIFGNPQLWMNNITKARLIMYWNLEEMRYESCSFTNFTTAFPEREMQACFFRKGVMETEIHWWWGTRDCDGSLNSYCEGLNVDLAFSCATRIRKWTRILVWEKAVYRV